ncbi:PepSY domain-containing protein [Staphylococcus ratti]|uniref:PepSY domain-containing protein n=1 Tax=Staphylococcus ratti TaxID=2892440 RepID=A0ABY3PF56_9STAP|nr:PepSY domain-containing protein [Staphylococcus ratti]UEX90935.1 PepSY domain-containing protein [Staphylococcus ratti]
MFTKKNWPLIIPIAVGTLMAGSYFYVLRLENDKNIPPNEVLESVKQYFHNVTGSFILYETISYQKANTDYIAYKGGITTERNNIVHQYTFYVDAKTGAIIDIIENQES